LFVFHSPESDWIADCHHLQIVTFAAMQFGYDGSYFSGIDLGIKKYTAHRLILQGIQVLQPFLKVYGHFDPATNKYMLSSKVLSVVTSIINAGEFVGACSSFYLGDKLGLKKGLYISTFFVVVGVVLQVAGHDEASLICGRLFLGTLTLNSRPGTSH
jgi:MFS transporter, SP family, sugar:H+ symporter